MINAAGIKNPEFFMGYVEDNDDLNGRLRVRVIGVHPFATDDSVKTEDLPWALVARQGSMYSPYKIGDLVIGFFLDGRDAQHPLIIGKIHVGNFAMPASYSGGGQFVGDGSANVPAGDVSGDRVEYSYNYFISRGYSPEQSAGIVGNLMAESGNNLNVTAVGDGGMAYGIAQWHPDRQSKFQEVFGKDIRQSNLQEQLAFIDWELRNTESSAGNRIRMTTNAGEAAAAVDQYYERSSGAHRNRRISNANAILQQYGRTAGISSNMPSNPYLAPSQGSHDSFGEPALPPEVSGENLDETPALIHGATLQNVSFPSGTTISEPPIPTSGNPSDTTVLYNRHGGSSITVSGRNTSDEFIRVAHASGSVIAMDGNGNVSIRGIGDVFVTSEGNNIERTSKHKKVNAGHGFELVVSGGKLSLVSLGDMSFRSNGNMAFESGAKMTFNAGDAINMAGSKLAMMSRAATVDILSAQRLSIGSVGGSTNIVSQIGPVNIESGGGPISMKAEGSMVLRSGGTIGLDSSGKLVLKGDGAELGGGGNVDIQGSKINLNGPANVGDVEDVSSTESAISPDIDDPIPAIDVAEGEPFSLNPQSFISGAADDTEDVGGFGIGVNI